MVTTLKNKPILEEEIEEVTENETEEVTIDVPNGSQVVFKRSDFTCDGAWEWLLNGKELDEDAFIEEANWWRYWLLAMKLTEGTVCCYGEERSGKSLWAVFIAKQVKELFNKKVTANTHLSAGFGAYEYLDPASDFQREMDNLHKLAENSEGMSEVEIAKGLKDCKLHDRIIIIDEAQEVVGKDRRTNLSRGLGMMNRLYGHLHNLTIYLSQDMEDFDKRMVWNRKTHEVICGFETMYEETCTYIVRHKKGFSRMMHVQPKNWKHLWDTHELRGLSTGSKIRL